MSKPLQAQLYILPNTNTSFESELIYKTEMFQLREQPEPPPKHPAHHPIAHSLLVIDVASLSAGLGIRSPYVVTASGYGGHGPWQEPVVPALDDALLRI